MAADNLGKKTSAILQSLGVIGVCLVGFIFEWIVELPFYLRIAFQNFPRKKN